MTCLQGRKNACFKVDSSVKRVFRKLEEFVPILIALWKSKCHSALPFFHSRFVGKDGAEERHLDA